MLKFTPLRTPRPPSVILSGAKDLPSASREILRSAQDDSRASVNAYGGAPPAPLARRQCVRHVGGFLMTC